MPHKIRNTRGPEAIPAILIAIVAPAVLTVMLVISQSRSTRAAGFAEKPSHPAMPDRTRTSSSMTFSDVELDILETRDYVYRTYTDGEAPVDLCAVFQGNRKGTHPPDVCLEGSGSRIVSRQDRQTTVAGTPLTLRELVTIGPSGQYVFFAYIYKCGDVFTPSFYKQQVQIIWNGLTRQGLQGG